MTNKMRINEHLLLYNTLILTPPPIPQGTLVLQPVDKAGRGGGVTGRGGSLTESVGAYLQLPAI